MNFDEKKTLISYTCFLKFLWLWKDLLLKSKAHIAITGSILYAGTLINPENNEEGNQVVVSCDRWLSLPHNRLLLRCLLLCDIVKEQVRKLYWPWRKFLWPAILKHSIIANYFLSIDCSYDHVENLYKFLDQCMQYF